MQAASAVQVTIQRFGVWNAALGLICTTTATVAVAWLLTQHDELPGWSALLLIASVLTGVLGAFDLRRCQPIVLRWDTQRWHLTDLSREESLVEISELRVVWDLGGWMLLRLRGAAPPRALRNGWIPVQRRGLESHWHALRCAVHAQGAATAVPSTLDRQAGHG